MKFNGIVYDGEAEIPLGGYNVHDHHVQDEEVRRGMKIPLSEERRHALQEEVQMLLLTSRIAIGNIRKRQQGNASGEMAKVENDFMALQESALAVMETLSNPAQSLNLSDLISRVTSLESELRDDEDEEDQVVSNEQKAADAEKVKQALDKTALVLGLDESLAMLSNVQERNDALQQQIIAIQNGSDDLAVAVLAAMAIAQGDEERAARILERAAQAIEGSVAADSRAERMSITAAEISEAMGVSAEAGRVRIMENYDQWVGEPVRLFMEAYPVYREIAPPQLKDNAKGLWQEMDGFTGLIANCSHHCAQSLPREPGSDMQAFADSLNRMSETCADVAPMLFKKAADVIDHEIEQKRNARELAADLFSGHSHATQRTSDTLAKAGVGVSEPSLREQAADFRIAHDMKVPPVFPSLSRISTLWAEILHTRPQGKSAG